MTQKTVAVIGAGLTGLSTALYLKKQNIPFKVFEKSNRVGGVIQSHRKHGFLWESGPSTGTLGKPEAMELFEDSDSLDLLEIASPVSKKRYIWKKGKFRVIPSSPISGLFTPLFSLRDKFGILLEPFRPRGTDPYENLSSFVKRRLGESILDYAVDPFVSGVYASSPDILIPKYAFPKLYNLEQEYGSFLRGAFHKMREKKTDRDRKATKQVFSAKGGLGALVEKLETFIGAEHIVTGAQNLNCSPTEDGRYQIMQSGKLETFDGIIFAAGAEHLFEVFPFLNQPKFHDAVKVTYAPVIEAAVGFKKWNGLSLNGFGGLIPSKENRKLLGVLFMSSLFTDRAPAGGALLSVFMGGLRRTDYLSRSDSELRETVLAELGEMLRIPNPAPDLFEIARHEKAIPQYDILTAERMKIFGEIETAYPGLILGGNGVGGIGMADRIRQGSQMAFRLE
ncbi:MAG: protoporphyrinogen oxidase [Fibrobacter sp.]|jgi:oxygen-dependent protoporphyrinogen oxidase|nr:protoporphyrinogen oxidase [Fibrobacter sp.]